MSCDSLLHNRQFMGRGGLTGLFRESDAQPHTYNRDRQSLHEWQQSNTENSVLEPILKHISTAFNSLQHVCIYRITPKFHLLKSKCKSIANHMDAASLCIIMFAIFALFIVLLSRFIVDYEDIHSKPTQIMDNMEHPIQNDHQIINHTHSPMDILDVYNDEVVQEYDTIDNLFKPTPIPIIPEEEPEYDTMQQTETETMFNQWILVHSVNWKHIKTGQIMKIKHSKRNKVSTAVIQVIDPFKMNIGIQHENCWIFCHETIDIISSDRMIYLIQSMHIDDDDDDDDTITHEIIHENNQDNDETQSEHTSQFDPTTLYVSMEKVHDDHNTFKQWVHSELKDIQQSNDEFQDVLTDYLDDKMTKMLEMLQVQQNVIQSIQTHQQQTHYIGNNESTAQNDRALQWDWDSIENRIDDQIESVVKVQLEQKFGNLAQEIGHEIAKEIAAQHVNDHTHVDADNSNIMKGNEGNNDDRKKDLKTDWAHRVISHSKLKTNNDIFHEYGYWIMHNLLSKWNQQSISTTYKPGDCTPLAFARNDEHLETYITVELYQAIDVKQVSLYHYHSAILTRTAINAAPKDFQIWGSYNLSKWYDLGNFTYDYYDEEHIQYFDVVDMAQRKSNEEDDVDVDVDDVILEDDVEDTHIVNHTMIARDDSGDEGYMNGFKYIAFRLLSNYGGSDYGCIYRLRIFGDAMTGVPR